MKTRLWKELRKVKPNLKQYELAEAIDMNHVRLNQIANGKVEPSGFEIEVLCDFFNMSEADLFQPML